MNLKIGKSFSMSMNEFMDIPLSPLTIEILTLPSLTTSLVLTAMLLQHFFTLMMVNSERRFYVKFVAYFSKLAKDIENLKPNTGAHIVIMPSIDGKLNPLKPSISVIMIAVLCMYLV
jgi:hypothetical protein